MTADEPRRGPLAFLWRWLKRLLVALVLLVLVMRASLPLWLPPALHAAGRAAGLDVSYERLDLSLLGLSMELSHLEVRPAGSEDGAEADLLAQLEFLEVDVDVSALFTGTLRVHRVELDGLQAWLRREQDGRWELERLFAGKEAAESGAPEAQDDAAAETPGEPAPIDLGLPVEVTSLRLQGLALHLLDSASESGLETELRLDLLVSNLGHPERETRLELTAHSPELLGLLRVHGRGRSSGPDAQLDLGLNLTSLHLPPAATYLEPLGLRPVARDIDAGLDLSLRTAAADEEGLALDLELELDRLRLDADGEEALALDRVHLSAPTLSGLGLRTDEVLVSGLRAQARRRADGTLRVAGIDLVPGARREATEEPGEPEEPAAGSEGGTFELEVPEVRFEELGLAFHDAAADVQPVSLELLLEELRLGPFSTERGPDQVTELELRAASPGLFETLQLGGELRPFGKQLGMDLTLGIEGLAPERAGPYLAAAGLESTFERGRLAASIGARATPGPEGALEATLELTDLRLEDLRAPAPAEENAGMEPADLPEPTPALLLALERIGASLTVTPATATTRIEEVELAGLQLDARRDAEQRLHLLGFATGAEPPGAPAASTAAGPAASSEADITPVRRPVEAEKAPGAAGPDGPAPRLELGSVRWRDTRLTFEDRAVSPPVFLRLDDIGAELEDLVLGGTGERPSASLNVWLRSKVLAEELRLSGRITTRPGPLDLEADLALKGKGLELSPLAPYLTAASIEEQWEEASLDLDLGGFVRQEGDTLTAGADMTGLTFQSSGSELLSLAEVRMPELRIDPAGTTIAPLVVRGPELAVRRDADGGLHLFGLRFVPVTEPQPSSEEPGGPEPLELPGERALAGDSAAASAEQDGATQEEASTNLLRLRGLDLSGVRIRLVDESFEPVLETALEVGSSMGELVIGDPESRAQVTFRAGVEGALDELLLDGQLTLSPELNLFEGGLEASGLRAGPLAGYMPPDLPLVLEDGRARLSLEARLEQLEAGGHSLKLEASELDYRDGEEGEPLLLLDRLAVTAPRLDGAAGIFELDEIVVEGLEADARRTATDRIEFLGLAMLSPEPRVAEALPGRPYPAARPASSQEGAKEDESADAAVDRQLAAGLATVMNDSSLDVPVVNLGRLDLGIERLGFQDLTSSESEPLVARLRLMNEEPLRLLAPDPDELPPIELFLRGEAAPVVGELETKIQLDPWALEPGLDVDLAVRGIDGAGIVRLLPELEGKLDAPLLVDGVFTSTVDATLQVRRRGPLAIDLSAGFGLDLTVQDVALRGQPDGDVLLGFDSLLVDADTIRPASGSAHIQRLELVEPRGFVRQSPEGLEIAGLRIAPEPAAEADTGLDAASETEPGRSTEPQAEPGDGDEDAGQEIGDEGTDLEDGQGSRDQAAGQEPEQAPVRPQGTAPPSTPSPEVRIDRLLVTGIDFTYEDDRFDFPMVLPLEGMELEVRRFTTRSFEEPVPIVASLSVYGGPVDLPERRASNLVSGVLGAIGNVVAFRREDLKLESRPAFDEVTASVDLTLVPAPQGSVRARVRGLELVNFAGPAMAGGVQIGDGILNEAARLRFESDGSLRIDSQTDLSYLSLSEPEGGPISRYLKLPAPLDTVLFVLRDKDGDIKIPLSFSMPEGQVSASQVARRAGNLLLDLIAEALAGSPMRIVGGVLDFAGIQQGTTVDLEGVEPVRLDYEAGAVALDGDQREQLYGLLDLMRIDPSLILTVEHELALGDVELAEGLANPTAEDCRALATQLRAAKAQLLAQRDELAPSAAAYYAINDIASAERVASQVSELELRIGNLESALDVVLERLRPGASRGRARRTRRGTLELCESRLDALRRYVLDAPVTAISTRVDARRPRYQIVEGLERSALVLNLRRKR